ncbi:MAG TPA: hypothetical protein VH459_03845 [Gaiellales bacterium]|jgi:hypothetical protein
MTSRTVTAVLDAPSEQVFAFLSEVANLPTWATDFARELRYEGDRAKVVNGLGEFYFAIDADPGTGVIDMYAGQTEHAMTVFPSRVVALGPDRSAYTFTMFQAPGMDDALFDAQYRSLQNEFENIRARFGDAGS